MKIWHLEDEAVLDWVFDGILFDEVWVESSEDVHLALEQHLLSKLVLLGLGEGDLALDHALFELAGLVDTHLVADEVELGLDASPRGRLLQLQSLLPLQHLDDLPLLLLLPEPLDLLLLVSIPC